MTPTPDFLDGNAAAGDLESLFGTDMTMASGQCHGCGKQMMLAETHAYLMRPRDGVALPRLQRRAAAHGPLSP